MSSLGSNRRNGEMSFDSFRASPPKEGRRAGHSVSNGAPNGGTKANRRLWRDAKPNGKLFQQFPL